MMEVHLMYELLQVLLALLDEWVQEALVHDVLLYFVQLDVLKNYALNFADYLIESVGLIANMFVYLRMLLTEYFEVMLQIVPNVHAWNGWLVQVLVEELKGYCFDSDVVLENGQVLLAVPSCRLDHSVLDSRV